jgi:uncharacterized Rossmann fold enzyme
MATVAEWVSTYDALPKSLIGESVFIIGGGPSLRNFQSRQLEGKKVVVTNEAFSLYPSAHALMFVDVGWWQRRVHEVLEVFEGLIIGRGPYGRMYKAQGREVVNVGFKSGMVWSEDARLVGGKNSGLAAINAAFLMGAKRAFLLGFDCRNVAGRNNYHHLHDDASQRNVGHRYLNLFLPEFLEASKRIESLRRVEGVEFEVVNITPGSALKCFPERSIDWAMKESA